MWIRLHGPNMQTSSYLEQTLFYEQSPAVDQFFEAKSNKLFEEEGRRFIEFYVQQPALPHASEESLGTPHKLKSGYMLTSEPCSVPLSPLDTFRYRRHCPPSHSGLLGLHRHDVENTDEFVRIAKVRPPAAPSWTGMTDMSDMQASENLFRIWSVFTILSTPCMTWLTRHYGTAVLYDSATRIVGSL
jgi:hypothetical protein